MLVVIATELQSAKDSAISKSCVKAKAGARGPSSRGQLCLVVANCEAGASDVTQHVVTWGGLGG